MPRYRCHKTVRALKIVAIHLCTEDKALLQFAGDPDENDYEQYPPTEISRKWVDEKKAEAGGYYVVYDDGYTSFSPAEAFESGYTRIA